MAMKRKLAELKNRLDQATGSNAAIDREIAASMDVLPEGHGWPAYTSSIDDCLALIGRRLPEWHWHVGHGPDGVLPYAALTRGSGDDGDVRIETSAPTVPLALLRAGVRALARH